MAHLQPGAEVLPEDLQQDHPQEELPVEEHLQDHPVEEHQQARLEEEHQQDPLEPGAEEDPPQLLEDVAVGDAEALAAQSRQRKRLSLRRRSKHL